METIQYVDDEIKFTSISDYLKDNGMDESQVDNYEYLPNPIKHFEMTGLKNIRTDNPVVAIRYKDVNRQPVTDSGIPFIRFRLDGMDVVAGKPKYLSPVGSSNHLYIPMKFKEVYDSAPTKTIFITEGEKKADITCAHGLPCVALSGVYCWGADGDEHTGSDKIIMPELSALIDAMKADKVVVVFDSDGQTISKKDVPLKIRNKLSIKDINSKLCVKNIDVHNAAKSLSMAIATQQKGIATAYGFCKYIIDDDRWVKNGLDDWLKTSTSEAKDYLLYLEVTASVPLMAKEKKYTALGYMSTLNEMTAVIYRKDLDEIKTCLYSKFNVNTISMLIGEEDARRYQRQSESGLLQFDTNKASEDVKVECGSMGKWSMDSVKELGLWKTNDGSLIVNTADGPYLLNNTGLVKTSRYLEKTREYFTSTNEHGVKPRLKAVDLAYPLPAEVEKAYRTLADLLSPFAFESHRSGDAVHMLLGWLLGQIYTGVTSIRPHIYIDGPMGCGKTTILKVMAHALKGHANYIANGRESSTAGIIGMIGKDATTMIIDELEISDKEVKYGATNKLEGLLGIVKSSFNSNELGVDSVKGTQDGGYRASGGKSGFMFASLNKGSVDTAGESRIVVITVKESENKQTMVKGLRVGSDDYYAEAERCGGILMRFMLSEAVYNTYNEDVKHLKTDGILPAKDRLLDTFAYLYAPLFTMASYAQGNTPALEESKAGLHHSIIRAINAWSNTTKPIGYELLEKIMHARCRKTNSNGAPIESTVGKLIHESVVNGDEYAREGLSNVGIYLADERVNNIDDVMVYFHESIMQVLQQNDRNKFNEIKALKETGKIERRRFDGAQHRVVSIPFSVIKDI